MEPSCGMILGITVGVLLVVIVFAKMTSEKTAIKVVGALLISAFIILYIVTEMRSKKNQPVTKTPSPSPIQEIRKAADYESDLTERCKDWIYYRNKAYKLGREGDLAGAEKARVAMVTFDRDLRKKFTDKQISDEIARLEAGGN